MLHVMWFRRDLRLADNPALLAAIAAARAAGSDGVLPLFIVGPDLVRRAGGPRLAHLGASLHHLDAALGGPGSDQGAPHLHVRTGPAASVLADLSRQYGGIEVHHAAEYTPHARQRDAEVSQALAATGGRLVATGSPYAVAPGRVCKPDGSRYQVFTPYYRAWQAHGWRDPAPTPSTIEVRQLPGGAGLPQWRKPTGMTLPAAGEAAASAQWARFLQTALPGYPKDRDRPDLPSTSLMSTPLRFGEIHPRTLLADLARAGESGGPEVAAGAQAVAREVCWREFFADVLFHRPDTVTANLNPAFDAMPHEDGPAAGQALTAWQQGRTGYPLVDAGMRELTHTGLVHNRVRMVVASFLVKDLHLPWWIGAAHFMHWLLDGDLASNTHNWQWVAGCGADAAPYFRIFNPVFQGLKFDPDGDYVRRYVPELAHLPGKSVHTPWEAPDGYAHGYPRRIVDHAEEREESLRRYEALRR